jgi:iron complex transport system substrate-binding protein
VLALEWFEPAYYGGHWVPEQVEWGGGACVLGAARARSEGVSWETIAASDPDVVVCMPCGYDAPQTRELLRSVEQRPEWNGLRAVREGRVLCVDANAYFSRPSLRVVTGAQIIGHILHPDRVPLPEGASRPIRVSRSV